MAEWWRLPCSVGNNPQHPGPAQALAPQLETLRWETCETPNYKGADFPLLTNGWRAARALKVSHGLRAVAE